MKKIIFSILLCITSLICFGGCSNSMSSNSSPKDALTGFLDSLQKGSYSSAKIYYSDNLDNMANLKNQIEDISPLLSNKVFEKISDFSYTIENISTDSNAPNKATALVHFNCYDLGSSIESLILDYIKTDIEMTFDGSKSEEIVTKVEENILKQIENSQKNYQDTVKITLVQKDGSWEVANIRENTALINALFGNIIYTINDLSKIIRQ